MIFSLLDLNILKGQYLKEIIEFVKKEQFDICTFQEVTGGLASRDQKTDCFRLLEKHLNLKGVLTVSFRLKEDPYSYFGNATFFSKKFILKQKNVVWLKPYALVDNFPNGDPRWALTPYCALILKLQSRTSFFVVKTHGAWSPVAKDTPEKTRQAKILFERLQELRQPFILSGDFNMVRNTQVINLYESLSTNLTEKYNVKNTLNLRLHYSKNELPQGLAVDHIFVSPGIKVKKFQVLDTLNLSDHLPLTLGFEI